MRASLDLRKWAAELKVGDAVTMVTDLPGDKPEISTVGSATGGRVYVLVPGREPATYCFGRHTLEEVAGKRVVKRRLRPADPEEAERAVELARLARLRLIVTRQHPEDRVVRALLALLENAGHA